MKAFLTFSAMPSGIFAVILAMLLASLVIVLAKMQFLGGPYAALRRALLPLLWIGTREWHTTFSEFRRRESFIRQAWLVAWTFLFFLCLVVLAATLPLPK